MAQDTADFAQGADCPVGPDTLPVGAACTIYVSFTPHSGGFKSASLAIGDSTPSSPQTVALGGRGLSQTAGERLSEFVVSSARRPSGRRAANRPCRSPTRAAGRWRVASIGVTGVDAGDFAQTNACPASLAAGANCAIASPSRRTPRKPRAASLTISDSATGSPHSVALSGTGLSGGDLPER